MHKCPINFAGVQNSVHVGHDVADPIWSVVLTGLLCASVFR